MKHGPSVLWWGHFDPEYSRNRIIANGFRELGWTLREFRPATTRLADLEALLHWIKTPDLVYVPCFCQWDIAAAHRFSRLRGRPLLVDPLISLYDTRVFERRSVEAGSPRAKRLHRREQKSYSSADGILVDTPAHGEYFSAEFGLDRSKLQVVHVGAEESLFFPLSEAKQRQEPERPLQVLFYGSFIPLQGTEVIAEAIHQYQGPAVTWHFLGGDGSSRLDACIQATQGLDNVYFENSIPYAQLPARIHRADILLGVFGRTDKTTRVIPNKLYQSIACAKPTITSIGPYPGELLESQDCGIEWVPAGDAAALAKAVAKLAAEPELLSARGSQARESYDNYFSNRQIVKELAHALEALSVWK
jgi:glycosyltransferase involved in cell wall biosynthesis